MMRSMSSLARAAATVRRWLALTCCLLAALPGASARAEERYEIVLSSGQWYTGVGNAHSASKPWGADWPVPYEVEQYDIRSRGASLETSVSVSGEMEVGRLLTLGQAQVAASPSSGFGISGGSGGYIALEWTDSLAVLPTALRDPDGFLRLPWHIDYSGEIEIEGIGAGSQTGAQLRMRLSALVSPFGCHYCNVLGYSTPTYQGLEFTQSFFAAEGVSIYDIGALPANPYHGVIAIPRWANQVQLSASMVMEIGAGAPGIGTFNVTAQQPRPFRFYIDKTALEFGQLVQSSSGANYATAVPEPSAGVLMSAGLVLLAARRRWQPRCAPRTHTA